MNRIAEFAKNLGKDSDNGSATSSDNVAKGAGAKDADLETNSAKGTPEPSSPRTLPTAEASRR